MSSDKRYDALENLRRALEGPFMSTDWYYAGCGTVEAKHRIGPVEIAHPEPIDGSAEFIAAANPDTIRSLVADYDALTARVEAAERDARRYAWLRKEARIAISGQSVIRSTLKNGTPFVEFPNWIRASDFRGDGHPEYRDNFDAAIDAASGQSTGETE